MPDPILSNTLAYILRSLDLIEKRSAAIHLPEDFIKNSEGLLLLDGISMRLQAVSEQVKKIESIQPGSFAHVGFDPQPIIRFRDFISHHYDEADYEVIFDVCKNHLSAFREAVLKLMQEVG